MPNYNAELDDYKPSANQNMSTLVSSSLEQDLKKQILGRSEAEKTFRPWWDTVEDYLLNSLVLLGFLTLPTAYVTGNPVECVLHPSLWNDSGVWDAVGVGQMPIGSSIGNDNDDDAEFVEENIGYPVSSVRITHWYVKRYCTEKFVSKFVFYFPYILLIVPLTLVLVDRIFIKTFAAGNKIKQFYELLVEESLRREDVEMLSRENMKNLHEIMQSFRFSNVCYWSYLSRTCIEIVLSIGLFLIYWCWGMPNLTREVDCDVHGLRHTCVLPNHQFYWYILAVSSAFLCIYILCNVYNLIWIACPQLGVMYRIVRKYQEHQDAQIIRNSRFAKAANTLAASGLSTTNAPSSTVTPSVITRTSPNASTNLSVDPKTNSRRRSTFEDRVDGHNSLQHEMLGKPAISPNNFLAVYFDRRHKDLKLLLNLLAETSGLPESFRILTLLDKKFQSLWKPQNLRFEEYETILPNQKLRSHSIIVRWNDAPIAHFLANYDASLSFEYTIDISPSPVAEIGLKSVLYKKDNDQDESQAMFQSTNPQAEEDLYGMKGEDKTATERPLLSNYTQTHYRCNSAVHGNNTKQGNDDRTIHNIERGNSSTTSNLADKITGTNYGRDRNRFRYEVCFDNIVEEEDEYTVTISTELNGRTVTQMVEKFPMGRPDTL